MIIMRALWVDKRPHNYFNLKEVNVLRDVPYNPPDEALEALARCLYPAMLSYFDSEQGRREFEEWKSRRDIAPADKQDGGADVA